MGLAGQKRLRRGLSGRRHCFYTSESTCPGSLYFIVGLFLVLYQMVLFKRITVHDNLKNMQLVNGVSAFQYITWFDEEGIALINLTNHAEGKILYRHFIKVIETEDILAVQTKKWFVPVFKDQLGRARWRSCLPS